jgi:Palmitoyl protein thioesterase
MAPFQLRKLRRQDDQITFPAMAQPPFGIVKPYYPIVYVRGYAMRAGDREETFYDTYYGFAATSVEKRQAPPPRYFEADVFEGQLIRFMKMKDYGYADPVNRGLETFHDNPARSLWVSRFYDTDIFGNRVRQIEDHAEDLRSLICETIPDRLKTVGVDLGPDDRDFKVNLIAHSMGGLVCRTLIQNLLPTRGEDPKRWIYRLVTLGSPHRGIDLGRIPDVVEKFVTSELNPFDSNIFQEPRMRDYLRLPSNDYDVHSLGDPDAPLAFPVKRCLCIIGSDYQSYGEVRELTGNFSDGLVKQDRAYVVAGTRAANDEDYPDNQKCYWANVHRAHSGRRGIVNSFESYENIERFLFGDAKVDIWLDNLDLSANPPASDKDFLDFEFLLSVRKTGVYLHERQQNPCENAIRIKRSELSNQLRLHTVFLNSRHRDDASEYSHFAAKIRIVEHRLQQGFLWDTEYPERPIYNETIEVRLGDIDNSGSATVGYRWLSEAADWTTVTTDTTGITRIPLRGAGSVRGDLLISGEAWPAVVETRDDI